MIEIRFQTATTTGFRDISRNAVRSIDAVGSNFLELEWKFRKYFIGPDV